MWKSGSSNNINDRVNIEFNIQENRKLYKLIYILCNIPRCSTDSVLHMRHVLSTMLR